MTSENETGIWLAVVATLLLLAAPALAQGDTSNLQVHGYLTQAYGTADGGQFLGIPDSGTSSYRTMALQFRYALNDDDAIVVQLAHEKYGLSPVARYRDDVELDWAFYRHTFRNGSTVKVGRVLVPTGIYNEIRDVGTLLPFYRPDHNFYGDGTFSTETVDGLSASHSVALADWSIDADMFYGNSLVIIPDSGEFGSSQVPSDDMFGGQLWVNSPIEGVRAGTSVFRADVFGLESDDKGSPILIKRVSAEAALEKFEVRGEYGVSSWDAGDYKYGYAHIGVPIGKFSLNGQYSFADLDLTVNTPFGPLDLSERWDEEFAVGINYNYRYDVVVKLEHHMNEGFNADGVGFGSYPDAPAEVDYTLLSLSVAF